MSRANSQQLLQFLLSTESGIKLICLEYISESVYQTKIIQNLSTMRHTSKHFEN